MDSPGGLSRIDWLRAVDPSLTAAAAKAVVTVAQAAVTVQDPSPFEDAKATARRAVHEALLAGAQDGSAPVGNAAQVIELGQRWMRSPTRTSSLRPWSTSPDRRRRCGRRTSPRSAGCTPTGCGRRVTSTISTTPAEGREACGSHGPTRRAWSTSAPSSTPSTPPSSRAPSILSLLPSRCSTRTPVR